jgi:YbbR domain-containing protein
MKPPSRWKHFISENLSYKIVALFIAIILWLTIMGRRDLILTKNIEVEFRTSGIYRIVGQTADQIRLRLSGPRSALKEIMDGTKTKPLVIDISDRGAGVFDIDVPVNRIDLPQGVKILSIRPNLVRVEVAKTP